MPLALGSRVLGRYVVEAVLGEGGMGIVYRGRHDVLGFPVALKILSGHGDELLGRFEREARLMARIRHPNIVSVLDFGLAEDGLPCIVMEHVDGESLQARLERRRVLPWTEAVETALGILAGLDAVHGASVLHRDLKPGNVLIAAGPPEAVKLIDFGIAKPEGTDATRYTHTGHIVGTPGYLAPERLRNVPVDARSDLYAVGLILHEMMAGDLPFGGASMESVLKRALVPAPPLEVPEGLPTPPRALRDLVARALAIAPEDRPPTARRMSEELLAAARGTVPPPLSSSRPRPVPPTPARPSPPAVPEPSRTVSSPPPAEAPFRNVLLAMRLPAVRLASADERRWLASLVAPPGRGYTLGTTHWFAILPVEGETDRARDRLESMLRALEGRYRDAARLEWGATRNDVEVTAAALAGAAPLPAELRALLNRLSPGE